MAPLAARRKTPAGTEHPVHPVDEVLPLSRLSLYGFQHVLAFYAGAVLVPIILGNSLGLSAQELVYLINADLVTAGIATIIQAWGFWRIGARLPLVQGATFTAVSPMIAIGQGAGGGTAGLLVVYGAVITGGIATFLFAPFVGRLAAYFPPIVTGTLLTVIGIVLIPVALQDVGGGPDLVGQSGYGEPSHVAYAGGTLALILLVTRFGGPFLRSIAVLIGLIGGTAAAWLLGDASLSAVEQADWVGISTPFHYGVPEFSVFPMLAMVVVMMITMVETTGDVYAMGEITGREVDGETVGRALRADGLATVLGGVFNSFPYVAFAENIGLVRISRITSRFVVVAAGVFMILLGLVPKAGAVVASVPHPVLGGAAIAMFGMVATVGIQILSKVDLREERNALILAVSLGAAMLPTTVEPLFERMPTEVRAVLGSGITLGSLTAMLLNLFFHSFGDRRTREDIDWDGLADADAADAGGGTGRRDDGKDWNAWAPRSRGHEGPGAHADEDARTGYDDQDGRAGQDAPAGQASRGGDRGTRSGWGGYAARPGSGGGHAGAAPGEPGYTAGGGHGAHGTHGTHGGYSGYAGNPGYGSPAGAPGTGAADVYPGAGNDAGDPGRTAGYGGDSGYGGDPGYGRGADPDGWDGSR
ncbi:nucleobase:cation symporter-2 family protein [Streptomyces sp. NPDC089799]|uniref:nucleobase:cation symporter-2 family protein n=1 Tax=Streptomyces sp. NPDC089799 TaxID=3155066 RepID=UPI0034280018